MHHLGLCVLYLCINNKALPTVFEVTNMTGPIILGRTQAKAIVYVQFPQIQQPHAFIMFPTTLKKRFAQPRHPHQRLYSVAQPLPPEPPNPEHIYTKINPQK